MGGRSCFFYEQVLGLIRCRKSSIFATYSKRHLRVCRVTCGGPVISFSNPSSSQ